MPPRVAAPRRHLGDGATAPIGARRRYATGVSRWYGGCCGR